jgi:peptide/nickel transport system substrate-binding protein
MKRLVGISTLVLALLATALVGVSAQGVTLVWGEDQPDFATLDPRITQSRHEEQVITQIFDPLIYADENGKYYPGLASSWTRSQDGLSYTFTLRKDVTFHDGTPFDASAVKFTFDSIADPKLGSQGAIDYLGPYDGTEVVSQYVARVKFKRPYAAALQSFSENELAMVSPTAVRRLGDNGFGRAPVGTGPFKFVSWEAGKQIILEKNADYKWGPIFFKNRGSAKVDRVVIRLIANNGTRVAALDAGEIDIADLTPPLDMRRFRDNPKFKTMVGNVGGLPFGMLFNTSRGPMTDIRVRQAFMHAVDRPKLAQNLFFGFADASYGPISSTTPGYWNGVEKYYPHDLEKANQLLEAAGWKMGAGGIRAKDGKPLQLYFPALLEPETAVAVQAEVKKVGIDLKVENVLKAKQDEDILSNNYDVLVIRWVLNDPGVLSIPFHTKNIPEPGKFKFNWSRLSDKKLDTVLDNGATARSNIERAGIYQQAQKIIMDQAIFFALHQQVQLLAFSNKFTGYRFAPGNWQVRFYDVEPVR